MHIKMLSVFGSYIELLHTHQKPPVPKQKTLAAHVLISTRHPLPR